MTPAAELPYRRLWREPWASQVAVQATAVRGQLHHALARSPRPEAADLETRWHVEQLLRAAETAAERGRLPWRGPFDWWRGASVERAHYCLHAAKTAFVDVLDESEVEARIPAAVGRVGDCLRAHDLRRRKIEALLSSHAPAPVKRNCWKGILRRRQEADALADQRSLLVKRALLKNALEIGYDASDQLHSRLRAFRNLLIVVSVVLSGFVLGVVVLVWQSVESVPLCFTPPIAAAQTPGEPASITTRTVCPSKEDPTTGTRSDFTTAAAEHDILVVVGLGAVGGALAAVFAIRNIRGTSTPYDVPLALALLKVPTGSLTAVAGIILLTGDVVPGLSELDSQGQILAYALLLGYAQQLLTQLIDKRGQTVLDAVPSKEVARSSPSSSSAQTTPASAPAPPDPTSTTNGRRR